MLTRALLGVLGGAGLLAHTLAGAFVRLLICGQAFMCVKLTWMLNVRVDWSSKTCNSECHSHCLGVVVVRRR